MLLIIRGIRLSCSSVTNNAFGLISSAIECYLCSGTPITRANISVALGQPLFMKRSVTVCKFCRWLIMTVLLPILKAR
ncbi:putative membrane protein [Fusarium oxysporum f. sp. albedinis]|nr:putative membrane protein [Fusarium oxysporum f. sp. albedinis]